MVEEAMILKKGDMFEMWGKCDRFLVTTNSTIKKDGGLVMGRGAAKQLRDLIPESAWRLGNRIAGRDLYGLAVVDDPDTYDKHGQIYGGFQVKRHFSDSADLELIRYSARLLRQYATFPEGIAHYDLYVLNFPGIGNGKLPREKVLPILEEYLGDIPNVWVYEYE